jgi:hypothetical protein
MSLTVGQAVELQLASPNSLLTGKITGKLFNLISMVVRYSIAGIAALSLILTPAEVVTLNSLLTGKRTRGNLMFERGLVRYRSVNPVRRASGLTLCFGYGITNKASRKLSLS